MHHIAKLLRAELLLGARRSWFVKRTMAGITVAVVLFSASLVPSGAGAAADPVAATKDRISAVQAQIEAGATQVYALTLAFQQANLDAMTLGQQVSADQAQIAQLQTQVTGSQNVLRKEALLSYTAGGGNLDVPAQGGDPAVRAEYLQVATGNLRDSLDHFQSEQRQLSTAETTLLQQEHRSQAAMAAAAGARLHALSAASAEQGQLDQLQAQLTRFVEAAAVAAKQQAAADAAAAASTTQGLPVNNGLVSVVHTIVNVPAPAAPPAPAPPAAPAAPAPPPPTPGYTDAGGQWLQLRECESSDNYAENTGNGYYGAYQFSEQTWTGMGLPGRPDLESHQMQDQAAMTLQSERGWGQWPACSAALGFH